MGITLSEFFAEATTLSPETQLNLRMDKKWNTLNPAQKQLILEVMEQFR